MTLPRSPCPSSNPASTWDPGAGGLTAESWPRRPEQLEAGAPPETQQAPNPQEVSEQVSGLAGAAHGHFLHSLGLGP